MTHLDKTETMSRTAARNAVTVGLSRINGEEYLLTFDPIRWVYDVTLDGVHVVTLNTKKITVAKNWLRDYLDT